MHILNNTEEEFCKCSGPEFAVDSLWGSAYCLINRHGECYAEAEDKQGKFIHSEEALLASHGRCPKCNGHIYTVIKHP